jgi:hypothetical protein
MAGKAWGLPQTSDSRAVSATGELVVIAGILANWTTPQLQDEGCMLPHPTNHYVTPQGDFVDL